MGSGRETGAVSGGRAARHGHPELWNNVDRIDEQAFGLETAAAPASAQDSEFRDLLAIAFDCFPIGAIIIALDGRFLHVNPTFSRFLGRSPEELRRYRLADFIDSAERSTFTDLTGAILDRGIDHYREERSFMRPDGTRIRLDMTGAVLKSAAGHKRAILALAHEVTDDAPALPMMNLRSVIPTALELISDRNSLQDEFETFCRTISQEFRNPLRIVEGYAEIVLEDNGATFDEATLRHLHTIRDQSRRLSAVVDHTLSLARIVSRPLCRQALDVSALALDAAAVVRAELHAHEVEAHIEPGLVVEGDASLVSQLLRQLFQNAFRFSRASAAPSVEFGRTEVDGAPAFYVRDNGVGFDMAQSSKLFVPFETLHEGSEAAGHGVGLAEVDRIVRRHGGQIWAEAAPGLGATFYFTFPEDDPSSSANA